MRSVVFSFALLLAPGALAETLPMSAPSPSPLARVTAPPPISTAPSPTPEAKPAPAPVPEIIPVSQLPDPGVIVRERDARENPPTGLISRSLVPIVGYNPTYLFFGGGGFFWDRTPDLSFGINGIVTQGLVFKVETDVEVTLRRWTISFHDEVARGFEPNYGVGMSTLPSDRVDLKLFKNMMRLEALWNWKLGLSFGPTMDYKIRRNYERAGDPTMGSSHSPYPEREDTIGFGVVERWDLRNDTRNPSLGWYQSIKAIAYPQWLQSSNGSYTQLQGDLRLYQFIISPEVVFAFALSGGITFSKPSYLNEYKLGGTDLLRGYLENRFRGRRFYTQQNEIRFPIYKALSGVSFMEFGEATDDAFGDPSMSYGAGIRIGLPPDYISKIRIDFAIGHDQRGVFLDFGQTF